MLFNFLLSVLSFSCALVAGAQDDNTGGLKVADDFHAYTGKIEDDVKIWRGIQYGRPPTQQEGLRFKLPQDPDPNQGDHDRDASANKPICLTSGESRKPLHDEDCLYLNVYAPATATATSKFPVVVWISGGGMTAVADGYRDGKDFVKTAGNDIIFVSFSYRVGIFGFLASEDLKKEGNLNFGLHDQRKAIEWVNRFIDRWGGDPNHVTVMGGSAGGGSVVYHLLGADSSDTQKSRRRSAKHRLRASAPQPKFVGAVAQSPSSPQVLTVDQSMYQWNNVVSQSRCSGDILQCLRFKTQDEILQYSNKVHYDGRANVPIYMWNPVIDGWIVTDLPFNLFSKGSFYKVPTILGSDSFDGMTFPPPSSAPVTDDASMNNFLLDNYPNLVDQQLHDLDSKPELQYSWHLDPKEHAERVYGDIRYQCSAVFYAGAMAKAQASNSNNNNNNNAANAPVWAYQYNVGTDGSVGHMAETGALLGPAIQGNSGTAVMQRHWVNFVKNLKPNDDWSAFDPNQPKRMVFGNGRGVMTDLDKGKDTNLKARCEYLAGIGAKILQ